MRQGKNIFRQAVVASCAMSAVAGTARADRPPNIVLFITDDHGMELECLGTVGLQTPTFNALAQQGVLFRDANAPNATCTPARTSLLSGMYPNETLVWHNCFSLMPHHEEGKPLNWSRNTRDNSFGEVDSFSTVPEWWPSPNQGPWPDVLDDLPTLNTLLRDHGYYLGLTQKHHIGYPHRFPFDYFRMWEAGLDREEEKLTYYRGMSEFIEQAGERPFFIFVNLTWTHRPFRDYTAITKLPLPDPDQIEIPSHFPDTAKVREDFALYYTTIQFSDEHAGEVVAALQDAGQFDNTVFIFTPDQGPAFHRYKNTAYEGGITVPLIIAGPGIEPREGISGERVSHVDLAPTLIDMLGLPVPDHMSGISIREFLAGESSTTGRQYNYGVYHQPLPDYSCEYPTRSIGDGRWKYIRNFAPERTYQQAADNMTEGSPWYNFTYGETVRVGEDNLESWAFLQSLYNRPAEEFFDLQNDPHEVNNLLAGDVPLDAEQQAALETLRTQLRTWMDERNDNGLMIQRSGLTPFSDGFESYAPGDFQTQTIQWEPAGAGGPMTVQTNAPGWAGESTGPWVRAGTGVSWAAADEALGGKLAAGQPFEVSVRIGFDGAGTWGGIWMGSSETRYQAVVLGNNDAGTGEHSGNNLLRTYATTNGIDLVAVETFESSAPNQTQGGIWYELIVTGEQGSRQVRVSVRNTDSGEWLVQEQAMDLGREIEVGDRFGFGSIDSPAYGFDLFSQSYRFPFYDGFRIGSDSTAGEYVDQAGILGVNPILNGFDGAWGRASDAGWIRSSATAGLSYDGLWTTGGGLETTHGATRYYRSLNHPLTDGTYWFSYLYQQNNVSLSGTLGVELSPDGKGTVTGSAFLGNKNGQFALAEDSTRYAIEAASTNVTLFLAKIVVDSEVGSQVAVWLNPDLSGIGDESDLGEAATNAVFSSLTQIGGINLANFAGGTAASDRFMTIDELRLGTDLMSVLPEPPPPPALLLHENVFIEGTDTTAYYVEGKAILNRNPEVTGFATTAWTRTASWWNTLAAQNLTYQGLPTSGAAFHMSGTVSGRHSRSLAETHGAGTYWFSYLLQDKTALGSATIGVELGPTSGTGAVFLGNKNGQFALEGDTTANMGAVNTNVTFFLAKIVIDDEDGASVSAWLNPVLAEITDEASLGTADAMASVASLTSFNNLNLANFSGGNPREIVIDEIRLGRDLVSVIPGSGGSPPLVGYDAWAAGIEWGGMDSSPDADPNGNGMTNHEEYLADTDPTDPNSFLGIKALAFSGEVLHVEYWHGGPNADVYMEYRPSLIDGGWETVHTNRAPASPPGSAELAYDDVAGFFRLRAERNDL